MKSEYLPFLLTPLLLVLNSCMIENGYPTKVNKRFETDFGSEFNLTVSLPENYDKNKSYKAIFLLDAEWMLQECQGAISKNYSNPEYIIFGLGYVGKNNRMNDFTPSKTDEGTGKAEKLKLFIENEIFQDYIISEYPNINTERQNNIFIGHSLGGLFGAYLFFNNSPIFGNYLLISSTLTYDSEKIFGIEMANRLKVMNQSAKIFFGTGSLEEHGFHSSLQHFQKVLNQHYPNVIFKSEVYKNTEHVGVRMKSLENGLPFLITSQ